MDNNSLKNLERPELMCSQNYIAGKWTDSQAGSVYAVSNPATDKTFTTVQDSRGADALAATDAAQSAVPGHCDRANILKR